MKELDEIDWKKFRRGFSRKYTLHHGDVDKLALPITVLSVDPGTKNMGVRIDKITVKTSQCLYERIVELEESDSLPYSIVKYLEEIVEYIPLCNLIIIEKQLAMNKNMIIVENVLCASFLSIYYAGKSLLNNYLEREMISKAAVKKLIENECCIVSVSSRMKGVFFEGNIDKKLSFSIAREIIGKRYAKTVQNNWDKHRLTTDTKKKLDSKQRSDIGDTVLQIYAFLMGMDVLDDI